MNIHKLTSIRSIAIVAALAVTLAIPTFAQKGNGGSNGSNGNPPAQGTGTCVAGIGPLFDQIIPTALSSAEEAELVFMREEEKLARDVYQTLASRWQLPIFANIAKGEQNHMNSVLKVLDLYGVADPVVDDSIGAFTNPELGQAFVELTAKGDVSLVDALSVGALIEEIDIEDLAEMMAIATNDHVKLIGNNLAKGSRNHLRAYVWALNAQGVTYVPTHLDQAAFDAIVTSDMERRGVYGVDGEPVATCGRGGIGSGRFGGQGGNGGNGGNGPGDGTGTGTCPYGN